MSFRRSGRGGFDFEALQAWLARQTAEDAARRGGVRPPRGVGSIPTPRPFPRVLVGVVVVVLFAAFLLSAFANPVADYLWFGSVGFGSVWTTQLGYGLGLFGVGLVVGVAFLGGNLIVAWRLSGDPNDAALAGRAHVGRVGDAEIDWMTVVAALPRRFIRAIALAVAILLAFVTASRLAGSWPTVALWLHQVPYAASGAAVPDPIFGLDLAWWLFVLPFLHLVTGAATGLCVLALLLTGVAYGLAALRGADVLGRGPVLHVAFLAALLFVTIAAAQWLGRYDLSYAQNGAVPGVTATDAAVRLPLAAITAATSLLIAFALVVLALLRRGRATRLVAIGGGAWYVLLLVLGLVLPAAYQQLEVTPNQNAAEAPYIANNIALTRTGFALDSWEVRSYTGSATLTAADVSADQATFNNARLWDYRPLGRTLDQLQTVRQYYDFPDVDIDRYLINGQPTEVMLAAREMALDKSQTNPTWIAQHILYTHGFGLAMVPVNGVDPNGLPSLIIKDLPTVSTDGAPAVGQPRIYFGQRASTWVLVDAKSEEFDYPSSVGNGNDVTAQYAGSAGIGLGDSLARLFWAWHLGDLNLLISDQVTAGTKLLIHQSLADRLGTLAPFLSLDADPYLVVAPDGRLVWVQDAYLTTAALPDATGLGDSTLGATYDYIRNSVKITVDAYDGATHFYVNDPADPLIRAWAGIFPTMFEPLTAMPAGLQAHLRTPEGMFNAQAKTFARYHVTDVASFYKSDNLWTVPTVNEGDTQVLAPEAYYVEIRLPDGTAPEFVLIQPFVPASRPNMIAWVAARNDGTTRGQVIVYELPASLTIQGPTQIEARIDQDPVISGQISLWNQSGSTVIRGNLLVIPVGKSFLYLEPIYLQSTSSAFPELTKVVVASSTTVGWADTLGAALQAVTTGAGTGGTAGGGGSGGSGTPNPTPSPTPPGGSVGGLPSDTPGLIRYASDHFAAAKAAQAVGDFVTYGQELQKVQAALDALDALSGGTLAPSPSP
ncbi:MAG: UPF0182 family protein [Candidatus Limnocylindrales bacterium]